MSRREGSMRIEKGTVFVLTAGEYSDYGIITALRALRDIDTDEILAAVSACDQFDYRDETADRLIDGGLAERAVAMEVNIEKGGYWNGNRDFVKVTKV
jgi:hypothetical protein